MEGMLVGVMHLHSFVRWVVTIATVALLIYLVYAMTRGDESLKRPKLVTYWTILFDVQGLLGIILLLGMGFQVRYRIEHAVLMLVAIVVAHLAARWKNAPVATWARNSLIVVVIALLLVFVGVQMLPQGWFG